MFIFCFDNKEEKFKTITYFYRKNVKYLLAIADNILHDRSKAEDIVHDVFENIMKRWNEYDLQCEKKVKSLLAIITCSYAKNEYRRSSRIEYCGSMASNMDISEETPESLLFDKAAYQHVIQIITSMDSMYSEILLYRVVFQYSTKEIAAILRVSDETVRKRLQRARDQIETFLRREGILS